MTMGTEAEKLVKIFEYALNQEQTGMSFFKTSLERAGTGGGTKALQDLIAEEQLHIEFLMGIINDLKENGSIAPDYLDKVKIPPSNYFDERARKEFMEQSVDQSMTPDVTIFNVAYLIEKDLVEFYLNRANETTDKQAKDALVMLANWEKEHEVLFKEMRDKLTLAYSAMPWGG